MPLSIPSDYRYRFTGHERVLHNVQAEEGLDRVIDLFGYKRVFVVCSRTLNMRTNVIDRIRKRLGERLVGLTDEVGEHSPLSNIIKAALAVRDSRAAESRRGAAAADCRAEYRRSRYRAGDAGHPEQCPGRSDDHIHQALSGR